MRETGRFLGERPKHLETWTDRTGQTDTQASNANAAIRSRLRTGRVAAEYYFQGIADWESGQTRQARGLGSWFARLPCPLAHLPTCIHLSRSVSRIRRIFAPRVRTVGAVRFYRGDGRPRKPATLGCGLPAGSGQAGKTSSSSMEIECGNAETAC